MILTKNSVRPIYSILLYCYWYGAAETFQSCCERFTSNLSKFFRLPMENDQNEPLDLSLKRKSKKDGSEKVGKVSTPKADMHVVNLYVAGFRAHDNHGNKYRYIYFTNKYSLLGLSPTHTLYVIHQIV